MLEVPASLQVCGVQQEESRAHLEARHQAEMLLHVCAKHELYARGPQDALILFGHRRCKVEGLICLSQHVSCADVMVLQRASILQRKGAGLIGPDHLLQLL